MSSINATAGSTTQPTALITSGDNTATLNFQTNSINALVLDANQNANCTTTGAVKISAGTTGQRPTAVNGMMRYNTSNNTFEAYVGGAWTNLP